MGHFLAFILSLLVSTAYAADPRTGPYATTSATAQGPYGPATTQISGNNPDTGTPYWGSSNTYDLWKPKPTTSQFQGPYPLVVIIHGGGWSGGAKEDRDKDCPFWGSNGFVCVSINYRLQRSETGLSYPVTFVDAQLVFRYFRSVASSMNIIPDAITCEGDSAGGTMCEQASWSLSLKTNGSDTAPGLLTSYSWKPNYQIIRFGPTEFGGGAGASELTKAMATANATTTKIPTMLIQGYQDTTVPRANSHDIQNIYAGAQLPVYYYEYYGVHEFVGSCSSSCPTPSKSVTGNSSGSNFTNTYSTQTYKDAHLAEIRWLSSIMNGRGIKVNIP